MNYLKQRNLNIKVNQPSNSQPKFTYSQNLLNQESSNTFQQYCSSLDDDAKVPMENLLEQALLIEDGTNKQDYEKAKMLIQQLQREVDIRDKEIERKTEELDKAKMRIKLLERQFENKENKPTKIKKKTTEKKIVSLSEEQKPFKNQSLSCLSQVSIALFRQFCLSYEKMFEDFTHLVQRQKEESSEEKYSPQTKEYGNEVEEEFQDIFRFQQKLKKIQFQQKEVKNVIQGYQEIVNFYKHYCLQLKASLNECIYAFQSYISNVNTVKLPKFPFPSQLLSLISKQIVEFVTERQADLVEDNLQLKDILDGLIMKIRK